MALMKKTSLFALFLLCFLLFSSGMVREVEGRICESASHRFKGICVRGRNCANICQGEHFTDGHCAGVRRRCMCTKPC